MIPRPFHRDVDAIGVTKIFERFGGGRHLSRRRFDAEHNVPFDLAELARALGRSHVFALVTLASIASYGAIRAQMHAGSQSAQDLVSSPAIDGVVTVEGATLSIVGSDGRARPVGRTRGKIRSISVSESTGLIAVVTDARDQAVSLYSIADRKLRYLGGGVEPRRDPQRVALGDVDGDGRIEALVLVTGRARFDRRLALRPFVYGWDGSRLYPKWLGSRLSRPFNDATLVDLDVDGRAEVVAVEATRDGRRELAAYRWRGFGFERVATSSPHAALTNLDVDRRGRLYANADGIHCEIALDGERLIERQTVCTEILSPPNIPTPH